MTATLSIWSAPAKMSPEQEETRKELRDNQHFLETVIESIQDGVSVLDKDFTIIHTNSVMKEW